MQFATIACLALLVPLSGDAEKREPSRPTSPEPTATRVVGPLAPQVIFLGRTRPGGEAKPKVKVLDSDGIYYGDPKKSTKPSVIDSQKVWDKIPEYQEIKRRGLTENDHEYWVLMRKASKKFKAAVKSAAKKKGKDLVAEDGAIEVKGQTIPDITAAVIAAIP